MTQHSLICDPYKSWTILVTIENVYKMCLNNLRYSMKLKKHLIWKYIPVEAYVQVIVSPAWSLKPESEFVQISLVISPSITRQALLYRSPQQSNRLRIVSEINSIGALKVYMEI